MTFYCLIFKFFVEQKRNNVGAIQEWFKRELLDHGSNSASNLAYENDSFKAEVKELLLEKFRFLDEPFPELSLNFPENITWETNVERGGKKVELRTLNFKPPRPKKIVEKITFVRAEKKTTKL